MILISFVCLWLRNRKFSKVWWLWLRNWACYTHLNFKIEIGMAGSIFVSHPWNFAKLFFSWRSSNDLSTFFVDFDGFWSTKKLASLHLHVSKSRSPWSDAICNLESWLLYYSSWTLSPISHLCHFGSILKLILEKEILPKVTEIFAVICWLFFFNSLL